MSSLGCCFWWLLLGALIGWFLNYLLCKCCKSKTKETLTSPPPAPAAKAVPTPAAIAPVMKAAPVKKAAPAKKAAPVKKAAAKPKAAPAKKTPAKKATPKKAAPKAKAAVKKVAFDLAAAKAAGISIKSADDLTVIEGVGPKINALLKDGGLKTFAKVATATVPQMRAILDKGGARYRIANPSTWAKQAKLASNNKWKELKKLQDDLSGGIKK